MGEMMLRVTIDLIPYGFEDYKETLHKIDIANVKTFANDKANYIIKLDDSKELALKKFNRKEGALALVKAVFDEIENDK